MKKQIILLCLILATTLGTNTTQAQDVGQFLGGITMFAGNFPPRGWEFCHGQLLPIAQNQALFSILGTTYGGDGRTTFALPDLRGRVAIGEGQGPGLSDRRLGAKLGTQTETLSILHLPSHTHTVQSSTTEIAVNTGAGEEGVGNGQHISSQINAFSNSATDTKTLKGFSVTNTVNNTGGNQSHNNIQPITAINYIICVNGLFPSRN